MTSMPSRWNVRKGKGLPRRRSRTRHEGAIGCSSTPETVRTMSNILVMRIKEEAESRRAKRRACEGLTFSANVCGGPTRGRSVVHPCELAVALLQKIHECEHDARTVAAASEEPDTEQGSQNHPTRSFERRSNATSCLRAVTIVAAR